MPDPSTSDTSLNLNPKAKDQALAPHEVDLFQRALAAPLQSIPKEFETWLVDRIAVLLPLIPIGQIVGFAQFTAQTATPVATREGTSSSTYVDLSTVGPTLSDLPDGQYVLFFGSTIFVDVESGTNVGRMSVSVNGAAASDDDSCVGSTGTLISVMRAVVKDLDGGGVNTVTAKYRRGGTANPQFEQRWLMAVKYANL